MPTSTTARAASFRPEVLIGGRVTRVLAEQTAVDPSRLGHSIGDLTFEKMRRVDAALRVVLDPSVPGSRTGRCVWVIADAIILSEEQTGA